MQCFFRALGALGLLIGGSIVGWPKHPAEPDIVALTCSDTVLMGTLTVGIS